MTATHASTPAPTNAAIRALTDKEKETLRLLVEGYDAKSIARHLDLSVHTINERLRDARRKLAVSSSREAARMLREAEQKSPEFSGDRLLGDAASALALPDKAAPATTPRTGRRWGWTAGAFLMSIMLAFLAFSSLSGPQEAATAPAPAAEAPAEAPAEAAAEAPTKATTADKAIEQSARQWLALVDAGKWDASWNETGQSFKSLNTSAKWAEISREVRVPLGAVTSRVLMRINDVPAPPYGYRMLTFKTDFAQKPGTVETLSLQREGDAWRVVGYMIDYH